MCECVDEISYVKVTRPAAGGGFFFEGQREAFSAGATSLASISVVNGNY